MKKGLVIALSTVLFVAYYDINAMAGQTPIHTGGTAAHEVAYTWQEWKWVAVPNPTYWTSITFEEGITSLLNP